MLVTNESFLSAAEASNRRIKTYILLCSEEAPTFFLSDNAFIKLTINQRVESNQNTLKIGSACSSYIQLKLRNDVIKTKEGNTLTFKEWFATYPGRQKYIKVLGTYLDEDGNLAGNTEACLGKFYITEAVTSNDQKTVDIVAYDKMSQLRGEYTTSLTFPTTTWNGNQGCTTTLKMMIYELCQRLGIVMKNFDSLSDIEVERAPKGKYTDQEMLGFMAGCYGCNARFDGNGDLEFVWYTATPVKITRKLQHMGGFKRTCDEDLRVDFVVFSNITNGDVQIENTENSDDGEIDFEEFDAVDPASVPWLSFTYELKEVTLPTGEVLSGYLATVSRNTAYTGAFPSKLQIPNFVKHDGGTLLQNAAAVVAIADSGFSGTSITSVSLPSNMMTIGASAFSGCKGLTSITIPENVTSIGNSAFYTCPKLASVYWNAVNCTSVGAWTATTFRNNYISLIVIGDGVKNIPAAAFTGGAAGSNAEKVVVQIGNGVETIGTSAFRGLNIESITIPESVTSIGNTAFKECGSLTTVYFNARNCTYCGTSSSLAYAFADTNLRHIIIGPNVTQIPNYAFYAYGYTSQMLNLYIPGNVVSVGTKAFGNHTALERVDIGESGYMCLATMASDAFYNCTSVASVYICAAEDSVQNSPWGCKNSTIHWIG